MPSSTAVRDSVLSERSRCGDAAARCRAFFFSSRRRHTRYWRDWVQTCALPIWRGGACRGRPPRVRARDVVLALLVRSRPAGADGLGAAGDLEFDVLVLARSPRAGAKRALRPSLGEEGCRALQEWLVARAASWGQQVAPGRARVAFSEPGADGLELPDRVLRVDQPGGGLGERLAELVERGGAGGGVADRPL